MTPIRRAKAPVSALRAIAAWKALEDAFAAYDRALEETHGITRAQLQLLQVIGEREPVTLAELREHLGEHPATLGQMVDRLARGGRVALAPDPGDRRRRLVELTTAGRDLLSRARLAGPARLRRARVASERLDALSEALTDAVKLFGLTRWSTDSSTSE